MCGNKSRPNPCVVDHSTGYLTSHGLGNETNRPQIVITRVSRRNFPPTPTKNQLSSITPRDFKDRNCSRRGENHFASQWERATAPLPKSNPRRSPQQANVGLRQDRQLPRCHTLARSPRPDVSPRVPLRAQWTAGNSSSHMRRRAADPHGHYSARANLSALRPWPASSSPMPPPLASRRVRHRPGLRHSQSLASPPRATSDNPVIELNEASARKSQPVLQQAGHRPRDVQSQCAARISPRSCLVGAGPAPSSTPR